MDILKAYACNEIFIKNSRFLSEAFPVKTQQEARDCLKEQKAKYQDASHVVHAFVIGDAGELLGCSDDGEPSGTAGKPALAVLKGAGISNIIITITRWFGGTLLGTGGLVKAYGDSVREILLILEREKLVKKLHFIFSCSYPEYEFIKRNLQDFSIEINDTQFSEDVTISGFIPEAEKNTLCTFIENATKGKSVIFD